eukprot:TRINITY_DN11518_c0_g1_i1.p1 TRINITY_DN11518_c0_g1~~TRINITY_DN11518_c0_g1_i1.p1  ORF type:complete len:128 (-),score=25.70 TRINITY_DN11518_c0_g1_i1:361-744(-)
MQLRPLQGQHKASSQEFETVWQQSAQVVLPVRDGLTWTAVETMEQFWSTYKLGVVAFSEQGPMAFLMGQTQRPSSKVPGRGSLLMGQVRRSASGRFECELRTEEPEDLELFRDYVSKCLAESASGRE